MYQVINRSLLRRNFMNRLFRFRELHKESKNSPAIVQLRSKRLLKVRGEEASDFLQGLITNDMRHLNEGAQCMYAMFLNNRGRVMYDGLVYKWDDDGFLVECDRSIFNLLLKHLKLFKLKRKVNFDDISEELNIWALLPAKADAGASETGPTGDPPDVEFEAKNDFKVFKDPRLKELGCRVLAKNTFTNENMTKIIKNCVVLNDESVYRCLRYKVGVGEGPEDLPPGGCLPLEANADYLHGISFHKGCYIGQELTARIYHTGVIRKRLMPIRFLGEVTDYIEKDNAITAGEKVKTKIGKLKGLIEGFGLGLVRIKEALEAKTVYIQNNAAEVTKPEWWPLESPKDVQMTKPE